MAEGINPTERSRPFAAITGLKGRYLPRRYSRHLAGRRAPWLVVRRAIMPQWRGSDRRSRLPANWPTIRRRIFRRDGGRCTYRDYDGRRCNAPATDVDHIIPGDDHSDANLRSLCSAHHRTKSSSEGGTALAAIKRRNDQKFRRTEEHPGLL